MERKLRKIQNFNIDIFSFDDAFEYITNNFGQVITINPEMLESANKNKDFAQIVNEAELVIPDGVGIQIGLKILGQNVKRIPGIEFGKKLVDYCAKNSKKIALIGAKPEVINKVVENFKIEYPNINIVYIQDGYFKDDTAVQDEILKIQPDLVLVALGSPKQEFFIYDIKKQLPNTIFIGLGGSFDVWAGFVQRAPIIYQKLCLEWLYRTIKEPSRFKRIFPTLPVFVLKVIKERIFNNAR